MESLYDDLINKLNLQAHPEGGYYKETFRSKGIILPLYIFYLQKINFQLFTK